MKVVPIINAVGCVFLVAFIVAQWKTGQEVQKDLRAARLSERNTQNEKIEIEQRTFQLQADVDSLKAAVDLMRTEADVAKKKMADDELLINQLAIGMSFGFVNFQALNQAVEDRNSRIEQLNSSVAATRRRLDEAIEKLKQAGAR